ncbi:hypothetical protein BJ944DRAFT_242320 [Cunninghamella echinulata]|nr:hypothetical protein BJ944DRAFT_242320 [Cunninghamella echinulata]
MQSLKIINQSDNDNQSITETALNTTYSPICYVCQKVTSKYICPRCNLRYCSLACYKDQKQHGSCTESFYKDNVLAEMESLDNKDDNKKKIQQILNKFEMENDELYKEQQEEERYFKDDDEDNDSNLLKTMEQRFGDMDITQTDASVIWNMLSTQERHEFENLIKMENAWNILDLPDYEPWWCNTLSKIKPLDDAEEEGKENDANQTDLPILPEAIPPLTALLKTATPSPHLIYHLLHLLMTYAYLIRITMGDLAEDIDYTMTTLYHLSSSLLFSTITTTTTNMFHQVNDVCFNLRQQMIQLDNNSNNNTPPSSSIDILLLKDVEYLFNNGRDYILRALGELYEFLTILSKQQMLPPSLKKLNLTKKALSLATRKVYFFLVYGNHLLQQQQKDQLQLFLSSIQLTYQQLEMDQEQFNHQSNVAKQVVKSYHQSQLSNKKKVTFV